MQQVKKHTLHIYLSTYNFFLPKFMHLLLKNRIDLLFFLQQ